MDFAGPDWEGDSGFIILLEDAPQDPVVDDIKLWHLCCLIDEHPSVGRALDACIAAETKCVQFDGDENEWVAVEPPTE